MPDGGGPPVPERIDHYKIVRRLALGGMAEIFLAVDGKTGRRVAIKKILPHLVTDPDFLDRFFHEIRIQIGLKHPNIVELVDCSPTPSNAYIVMEYVDGGELYALRQESGRFPWEIALYAVDEALNGLAAAHAKGIVHRDIKPQNIMWTKDGAVKIGDFGISHAEHLTRLTMTGTVVGTPAHMSPEQARGDELDARTDLFSMGTVLYELLCGFNPFTADSIAVTLRRVAETEPELPSLLDPTIPPGVDTFLRKLHAKDRAARFPDAATASKALRAVFEKEKVERPAVLFRSFLDDPGAFVAARNRRLAAESAAAAETLLNDSSARPEEALWAAYRTVACLPHDAKAQELFRTAAIRAGQREKPLDNAKIRALEEALTKEPDNLALLLQLAKLYRLEHDFVNLMRFFRKLQALAPPDPYTQGQIASLLSSDAGAATRRAVPASVPASPRTVPAAPPARTGARVSRPRFSPPPSSRSSSSGRGGPAARPGCPARARPRLRPPFGSRRRPDPARSPGADETLARILERGSAAEKESGPAKAFDLYAEAAARTPRAETRAALYRTMADLARKAGDDARVLKALDLLAAIPALRGEALLTRGRVPREPPAGRGCPARLRAGPLRRRRRCRADGDAAPRTGGREAPGRAPRADALRGDPPLGAGFRRGAAGARRASRGSTAPPAARTTRGGSTRRSSASRRPAARPRRARRPRSRELDTPAAPEKGREDP